MSLSNTKFFIGIFVLLVYTGIGVFGLLQFGHMTEKPMIDCPYAPGLFSICENSFIHISNWQQFSNVIFPTLIIFSLLMLGIILFFYNQQNFFKQIKYFYRWKYFLYDKELCTYDNKIIKWLALFENSPSLYL